MALVYTEFDYFTSNFRDALTEIMKSGERYKRESVRAVLNQISVPKREIVILEN